MQKTSLFGRLKTQHSESHSNRQQCPSCLKLQSQLTESLLLVQQKQQQIQALLDDADNEALKIVQSELIDIREKYASLKKQVQRVQKENDDLFAENTRLGKQIVACKLLLKKYQQSSKQIPSADTTADTTHKDPENAARQLLKKQVEVQLFVYQQRVKQLQALNRQQCDEMSKLREYLKKRIKLQADRHKQLSPFC